MYYVNRSGNGWDVYPLDPIWEKPRDSEGYNPGICDEVLETANGSINLPKKERNVLFHE